MAKDEEEDDLLPDKDAAKGFYAKYEPKEILGRGISSTVRRCIEKETGKEFAAKIIDLGAATEAGDTNPYHMLEATRQEISILRQVMGHPYIIDLQDVFESDAFVFLVFELCPKGELFDYLTSVVTLSEKKTRTIMRQIFEGVEYIHAKNIVHRDLKPENILLDENHNVKITDFGFARRLKGDEKLTDLCGTPGYLAPETLKCNMFEGSPGYSKEVDIWACGVIMFTLLVGCPPFWHRKQMVMLRNIMEGKYSFTSPEWADISEDPKDLIRKCLVVDPAKRITVKEVLKHPFFNQMLFEQNIDGLKRSLSTKSRRMSRINDIALVLCPEPSTDGRTTYQLKSQNIRNTAASNANQMFYNSRTQTSYGYNKNQNSTVNNNNNNRNSMTNMYLNKQMNNNYTMNNNTPSTSANKFDYYGFNATTSTTIPEQSNNSNNNINILNSNNSNNSHYYNQSNYQSIDNNSRSLFVNTTTAGPHTFLKATTTATTAATAEMTTTRNDDNNSICSAPMTQEQQQQQQQQLLYQQQQQQFLQQQQAAYQEQVPTTTPTTSTATKQMHDHQQHFHQNHANNLNNNEKQQQEESFNYHSHPHHTHHHHPYLTHHYQCQCSHNNQLLQVDDVEQASLEHEQQQQEQQLKQQQQQQHDTHTTLTGVRLSSSSGSTPTITSTSSHSSAQPFKQQHQHQHQHPHGSPLVSVAAAPDAFASLTNTLSHCCVESLNYYAQRSSASKQLKTAVKCLTICWCCGNENLLLRKQSRFNARKKFQLAILVIRAVIRIRRLRYTAEPLRVEEAIRDPYRVKVLRKVIDGCAFRVYGHWVKKGEGQNRAALFENTPRTELHALYINNLSR